MDTGTLLLSQSEVAQCVDMKDIVEIVDTVFKAHGESKVVMPSKITLDMSALGVPNWMNAMPAYVEPAHTYGIKWAGGFINNPKEHDLPYVMATMVLNDPQTGLAKAVMDAMYITNMRTGASAAVGAHYLARADSSIVAFIGSGVQAWTSLQALSLGFEIEEVRAVDIVPEASERLVRQAAGLGINGYPVESNQEAVEGADIIVTATTAAEPLVMKQWVKPGAFVAKLGSYQELDDALTLGADKLVVDHRGQAEHRGELVHLFHTGRITQQEVYAELGDIVAGTLPGRESDDEVIVGALVGMGSEDVTIGSEVLKRARQKKLGQPFNFLA
jgi:ornithine cyclodeaminase/alanine dehydrogenase-like protein (mu-crystallin family)